MFKLLVPAVVLLLAAPAAAAAETASKAVHKTVALEKDGRVEIETYKGSVKVTAWDRHDVDVEARIEADGSCGDAKYQSEMVRDTEARIDSRAGSLSIRSDYGRVQDRSVWRLFSQCSALPFIHYTISMPRGASLELKDHKSRIAVADLASDVTIATHKGEVRLTGLAGRVRLETHKGDVRADFAKMSGDSRFETHSGDVEITVPRGAAFTVSAEVGRRGRFDSDFPVLMRSSSRRSREERIEGAVNGGGPTLRLTTHSGTFRLRSS